MRKLHFVLIIGICVLTAISCQSQEKRKSKKDKKTAMIELKTNKDTASYALGVQIGDNICRDGLDTVLDINMVLRGISDRAIDKSASMDASQANTVLQDFFKAEHRRRFADKIKTGEEFLATNGKRPEVKTTASGLQYEVISEGSGEKPTATSTVKVNYKGTLLDGSVFDSSYDRGEPAVFPLNRVIPAWTEGLQLMTVGSKYKLFVPYQLGYGEQGGGPIQPYETLIFEVELLSIEK